MATLPTTIFVSYSKAQCGVYDLGSAVARVLEGDTELPIAVGAALCAARLLHARVDRVDSLVAMNLEATGSRILTAKPVSSIGGP